MITACNLAVLLLRYSCNFLVGDGFYYGLVQLLQDWQIAILLNWRVAHVNENIQACLANPIMEKFLILHHVALLCCLSNSTHVKSSILRKNVARAVIIHLEHLHLLQIINEPSQLSIRCSTLNPRNFLLLLLNFLQSTRIFSSFCTLATILPRQHHQSLLVLCHPLKH